MNVSKTWRALLATACVLFLLPLAACTVEQTEEGKMPEVDVDVEEGNLPEYDVDAADVEIGTETKTIDVPDVDVDVSTEEKTIEVPDVDIDMPEDNDNDG